MNVTKESYPQLAQWNYRILCNPISRDLPLNRLRMVDELAPCMTAGRTYDEQVLTRAARFQLNPFDTDTFGKERANGRQWGLLDELMSEVRWLLTLEGIRGGVNLTPLVFFGLKFLFLDRLPKALAKLFFVC